MKNILLKPGFELIFSLSLVAVLGLPLLVLGQTQKNIRIEIVNGDTTINGKNIKKLSASERKDALDEMDNIGNITVIKEGTNGKSSIIVKKRKGSPEHNEILIERDGKFGDDLAFRDGNMLKDSSNKIVKLRRLRKLNDADSTFAFNFRMNDDSPLRLRLDRDFRMSGPGVRPMRLRFDNRNTQNFNYVNTDNDGISTHVTFNVSDASKEKAKSIASFDKAELDINDLNLSPEFSTGKTLISFNLPAKTTADVKFTDSEGKLLWADKVAAGSFSKKVSLPMNGIFYLTVKQGANIAIKKIVKED